MKKKGRNEKSEKGSSMRSQWSQIYGIDMFSDWKSFKFIEFVAIGQQQTKKKIVVVVLLALALGIYYGNPIVFKLSIFSSYSSFVEHSTHNNRIEMEWTIWQRHMPDHIIVKGGYFQCGWIVGWWNYLTLLN